MKLTILAAAVLVTAFGSTAGAQGWSNLGGNAARNGRVAASGPLSATARWSNLARPSIIAWAPFTEGSRVFTVRESGFPTNGGAANDALVAYDLTTGQELWDRTLAFGGDTNTEWIAWIGGVEGGRLFASRASHLKPGPIQAFDAASGSPLWTSTFTTQAFAYDGFVFAPNGDPIVGDWQTIARLDATSGALVWSAPRNRAVSGNCGAAATATALFIDEVSPGGQILTKLDLATGAELYSSTVMSGFTAQNSPFLSPDGQTVYFSRTQNNAAVDELFAFTDTGAALVELWSRPVRWTTSHEHGIGADGSIYTFLPDNSFVRLDPATGAVLSTAGILAPIGTSNLSPKTAIGGDGTVYVSNGWASSPATDGRLWAFNADLSVQHFVLNLDRQNQGGPALAEDGTLVVCDRAGVFAYQAPLVGTAFCAGDGTGSPCPCGNTGGAGEGCANSTGSGATLSATGSASIAADDLVLDAAGLLPSQAVLLFAGVNAVNGGNGVSFGDGLRCAGGTLKRLGVRSPNPGGEASWGPGLAAIGGWSAGDLRRLQAWYRDPVASPCGTGFNLSHGIEVQLLP